MTWLLVSDVDDTLTGDDAALVALTNEIERASETLLVAFNSSRPCASVRATIDSMAALPIPNYLIGALGTEIEYGDSGVRIEDYSQMLSATWRREQLDNVAQSLDFRRHAAEFQTPLKASYDVAGESAYREFLARIADERLRAKVIFSNQIKVDVVPEMAGKGSAIRFLVQQLGLPTNRVVVAGDSGNDVDMFHEPFYSIVVGNADKDLRAIRGAQVYHAAQFHAGGVLEGLRHWGALRPEGGY